MADFKSFQSILFKLVDSFENSYPEIRENGLDEANLRLTYLDRFFESLGWDIRNINQAPLHARDVIVEPYSGYTRKRPDYLFRVGGVDKFICEAKKPRDNIEKHYFQAQNYVYNMRLWVGVLCDFEFLIVFVVGGQPTKNRPFDPVPGWRLHYTDFKRSARKIWDLLSYEKVADGSLEEFLQNLPKISRKGKQGWLLKPDRNKTIDNEFLSYLESQRIKLAKVIVDQNSSTDGKQEKYWSERELTEATQHIIDRILFQRICEDREIDVGKSLRRTLDEWENKRAIKDQFWPMLISNFRYLQQTFNGGIYGKPKEVHFIDTLKVCDKWLADFIGDLTADDTKYIFSVISVAILGSVYERFLGSIVQPNGKVELKPEVRKAGGVYYTPDFIVDYIVEQTVGKLVEGKSPKQISKIKILDPACGSGSFLLRAFEHICERHIDWFLEHEEDRNKKLCYVDKNNNLHLTTGLKRTILTNNIFGVDIDPQAVEVTQMSLYLKVLEDENRQTLENDHRLFPKETFLPDLSENIKCGNSLIGTECLEHLGKDIASIGIINPFDWEDEFKSIIKKGGFDAVIGNPPYLNIDDTWGRGDIRLKCIKESYQEVYNDKTDILFYFLKRGVDLSKQYIGFIVSRALLEAYKADKLRGWLAKNINILEIMDFRNAYIFNGIGITTSIFLLSKSDKISHSSIYQLEKDNLDLLNIREKLSKKKIFDEIKVRTSKFDNKPWIFAQENSSDLLEKIDSQGEQIGEILEIGQGMQTGRNNVFGKLDESVINEWDLNEDLYYYRAKNSDIQRYEIINSGEIILYLEDVKYFKNLPKQVQKHLKKNESTLKERAAYIREDCDWWRYTWPLHSDLYERKRIISPYMATENRFASDDENQFLGLTDTIVLFDHEQEEDIKYILGLLNSKLLTWRFRYIGKLKSGGIYEYFWNSVSKIPIKRVKSKKHTRMHDKIIDRVDQMIELNKELRKTKSSSEQEILTRAIEKIDSQIDQIVFALYETTEAEIELINKELAK